MASPEQEFDSGQALAKLARLVAAGGVLACIGFHVWADIKSREVHKDIVMAKRNAAMTELSLERADVEIARIETARRTSMILTRLLREHRIRLTDSMVGD